jgi:glycine cleavage system H lipoate-binding protein
MTVLLVLFTLIIFLGIDALVQRSRARRAAAPAHSEDIHPYLELPYGLALAHNHTWTQKTSDGTLAIGIDEFLYRMIGGLDRILAPAVGTEVDPAMSNIALRSGEHALTLAAPIGGTVVAVNTAMLHDPSFYRRSPYESGWLLRVKPAADGSPGLATMTGKNAVRWLKEQTNIVRDFLYASFSTLQPATMLDGGMPVDGVLEQCPDEVWKEFQQTFMRLPATNEN